MRDDVTSASVISTFEFRDDGRYKVACPKGHSSIILLQQQKFEVLFDIGAYAIIDGYYREAISSFSSSLERFYEFFIKTALRENGVDEQNHLNAWKIVANQSERQLGAFVMLYACEFGHSPALLSNSKTAFRNEVIHKGKIPDKQEAMEFGQAVLDIIRPIITETKERFPKGVQDSIFFHLKECRGEPVKGEATATMNFPTIINLSVDEPSFHNRTLDQVIRGLVREG